MSAERIEHTIRVCEAAIDLAKLNGVSIGDAITAALLHDIGKYADIELQSLEDVPKPVRHSRIGAFIAEKLFGAPPLIVEAIAQHTTGAPAMSDLSKVIYLADYIEKGRSFEGLDTIRKAAYVDLDKGMLAALDRTLEQLQGKNNADISDMTRKAYEYYKQRIKADCRASLAIELFRN